MQAHREQRLLLILFLLIGVSLTTVLALTALNNNLNFFYSPATIAAGQAPINRQIRAGGMVVDGSLVQNDSLKFSFRIGDLQGAEVAVAFKGLLPDLFREGQGVVAIGKLNAQGVFIATEVLAKHDENYMPREVAEALEGYQRPKGVQNDP